MRTNSDKEHKNEPEAKALEPQKQGSEKDLTPQPQQEGGIKMPDAPKIELPKGGGAISGIGEKFEANPVTGTGSFTVPIALTGGRSEFSPMLALSYNSGGGNSPFGLGWNIGLPSISRKTQKELPKYQDGKESDTFLMSGAEDLIPALKKDGANYIKDEYTQPGYLIKRYRPRIEGLFARIEQWTDTSSGQIHWKSITPDNVSTIYGKSNACRISDPDAPNRIFQWFIEESWDATGNVIRYKYKSEDATGVATDIHERNRIGAVSYAQKYLKKVLYGNTLMKGDANFDANNEWLFKLVFDYGGHNETSPTEEPTLDWPVRQDPYSTYRSGFEIRSWRLCKRILMFHNMTELGGLTLVKSTHLSYNENPTASQLRSVVHKGHRQGNTAEMPPLEFGYSQAQIDDTLRYFDLEDLENLPAGVDGQQYQWSDLYGEGLRGILTEEPGGWFYKRNEGDEAYYADHDVNNPPAPNIRFGAQETVALKPNIGGTQQVSDFNGDGKTELLIRSENLVGYFSLNNNGEWTRFKHLENVPLLDWNDPNLRLLDLNGDGVADILLSTDYCFRYYPSSDDTGYEERVELPIFNDEELGPKLVLADSEQVIHLGDMSGDGLTDLIRIRNGEVCYWPNLGHGRFGKKVSMGNAPYLDHPEVFSKARVRLADMDGSGTTDLIYLGTNSVLYWNNQSGNSYSLQQEITLFPKTDNLSSVSALDLFGNGTSCLVWSSPLPGDEPSRIKYIDLFGQKPYLLKEVKNNMGALSRYHYAPSTKFYVRDRQEGKPWATKLSFPVQVLERMEVFDQVTGIRSVSRYAYHHGYFDASEKEFRGFGMVEQWDTEQRDKFGSPGLFQVGSNALGEDSHIPPIHTKSWYHLGFWENEKDITQHFAKEYYQLDNLAWELPQNKLPEGLNAEETRQAVRALKGQLLRTEMYADDETVLSQHPYTVSSSNYLVKKVQPQKDHEYGSFQVISQESLNYHYERNPSDPRIAHTMVLEADAYGKVLSSATIAYPRRGSGHDSAQQNGLLSYTENAYIHCDDDALFSFYRIGLLQQTKTFELTGSSFSSLLSIEDVSYDIDNASEIAYEVKATSGLQNRCFAEKLIYYWNEGLTASLPIGEVASHAQPYRTLELAFTPGLIAAAFNNDGTNRLTETMVLNEGHYLKQDGKYWVPSDVMNYDPSKFYNMVQTDHTTGGSTTFEHDSYNLFSTKTIDQLGNTVVGEVDYFAMTFKKSTEPNGNRQELVFDPRGMVTEVVVMGKTSETLGDSIGDPTQKFSYHLFEWLNHGEPNYTSTEARTEHGGTSPTWITSYEYSGGLGHAVLSKIQAEPGMAFDRDANNDLVLDINGDPELAFTNTRWVGSGRVVMNNKGLAVMEYEPYFSATHKFEDEDEVRTYGVSPVNHYDPEGRLVRTDYPDGTFTKVEFDCWKQCNYDQNDTSIDSQWYTDRNSPAVTDPEPSNQNERAAWLAAKHYNTPQKVHLDVLGREYLTQDDNGSFNGTVATHAMQNVLLHLDIEGKKTKVTNALAQETDYVYSMLPLSEDGVGQVLFTDSPDGGWRRTFARIDNSLVRAWNERGFALRNEYDVLKRATKSWVDEGSGERLTSFNVYGDNIGLSNPENNNLIGQSIRSFDQSGVLEIDQVDFKGNPLKSTRRLAKNFKTTVDWSTVASQTTLASIDSTASGLLETDSYVTLQTYDARNKPTLITQPDGSTHKPAYNEAGLLDSMEVQLVHEGAYTDYVSNIDYDAKGQRERIEYGNGTKTLYTYDENTFRMTLLHTTRTEERLVGGIPEEVEIDLQKISYSYDAVGNITHILDNAQQDEFFSNAVVSPEGSYEYDAVYRLIKATGREKTSLPSPGSGGYTPSSITTGGKSSDALSTYCESYQYDAIGNMEVVNHRETCGGAVNWKRNYQYTGTSSNLLQSTYSGTTAPTLPQYTYDAHGNITSMPHLSALNWDFSDQLKSTVKTDETTYYVYSGDERVRKVCFNTQTSKIKYERIYLGSYEVYKQYDGGSLELTRDTHHINDDKRKIALLEVKTFDGTAVPNSSRTTITRYQYTNHLDSASLELDENGLTISYEEYHPFGSSSYTMHTNNTDVSAKRYKYVHKERDDESGLYYYGARYYAAWLCRFISVDPLKDKYPHYTTYQYAGNKPINYIDLDGMEEGESTYSIYPPTPDFQFFNFLPPPDPPAKKNLLIGDKGSVETGEGAEYQPNASTGEGPQTPLTKKGQDFITQDRVTVLHSPGPFGNPTIIRKPPLVSLSDDQLLDMMFNYFPNYGYSEALEKDFRQNKGSTFTYVNEDGLPWGMSFSAIKESVKKGIENDIQFPMSMWDISSDIERPYIMPFTSSLTYAVPIGGIQRITVEVDLSSVKIQRTPETFRRDGSIASATTRYSMSVTITIWDNFGVDEGDFVDNDLATFVDREGLAAFWILQHQRGYKPQTVKVVNKNVQISGFVVH